MDNKDYYKVLGVSRTATQEEVKKAYRKKAHQHHPDKAGGDEQKFKEVNEAYQVLGNSQKRSQYDQFGSAYTHAQSQGAYGGFSGSADGFNVNVDDLGDIFGGIGDIFGFSSSARRGQQRRQGADIQVMMTIDFMEAVKGVSRDVELDKKVKCPHCHGNTAEPGTSIETCQVCGGSGRVMKIQRTILGNMQVQVSCSNCDGEGKTYAKKCSRCGGHGSIRERAALNIKIPAGIDNGETIRLSGQGEAGERGAQAGDLYVKIRITPHNRYERREYDIFTTEYISFTQAALGDKIDIETVDGTISLKIPPGTQSGTEFKLRSKGISRLQGRGTGDHIATIQILTPKNLTKRQKELLKELDS